MSSSLKRLSNRYQTTDAKKTFKDIENAIHTAVLKDPQDFYRTEALKGLHRIKKHGDWLESNSGLTLAQAMALVWTATNDNKVYSLSEHPERDEQDRINTFVEHLWRAQREYNLSESGLDDFNGSMPACLAGTFNKLVESLDLVHPDVKIIRSVEIANDFATESAQKFYENCENQQALCDAISADSDERTIEQQGLFESLRAFVREKLIENLGDLLTTDKMNEILDNLQYVPLPEPNNANTDSNTEQLLISGDLKDKAPARFGI